MTGSGSDTIGLSNTGTSNDLLVNATVSSGTGNITANAGRSITLGTANAFNTGGTVSLTTNTTSGVVTQTVSGTTITANNLVVNAAGKDVNNASVGTAAQGLVFNAAALTVTSSASTGNQFLNDAGTVAVNSLNAGQRSQLPRRAAPSPW